MIICDRCGKDTNAHTMSYFNEDVICLACDKLERAHPAFEKARRVETEQVASGNFNYRGVGLPADLRAKREE